jgi:hypothetical protein
MRQAGQLEDSPRPLLPRCDNACLHLPAQRDELRKSTRVDERHIRQVDDHFRTIESRPYGGEHVDSVRHVQLAPQMRDWNGGTGPSDCALRIHLLLAGVAQ